jgi:DNA polymerase phi
MTDEEEGTKLSTSTGSWKPQLHFVWNTIFDTYFPSSPSAVSEANRASFQDFFRTVVDGESLFVCFADCRILVQQLRFI